MQTTENYNNLSKLLPAIINTLTVYQIVPVPCCLHIGGANDAPSNNRLWSINSQVWYPNFSSLYR